MGSLILRSLTRVVVALPLAAILIAAYAWWGHEAFQLARQIDARRPTTMRYDDAAAAARDHELYVRLDDARLDCTQGLAGDTWAMADADGVIPAAAHLPSCPPKAALLEGVFREPPSSKAAFGGQLGSVAAGMTPSASATAQVSPASPCVQSSLASSRRT